MSKKKTVAMPKVGMRMIRGVELAVYDEFRKFLQFEMVPKATLGSGVTEAMREYMQRFRSAPRHERQR